MIVYDAGALVAAERNERPMWALHELAQMLDASVVTGDAADLRRLAGTAGFAVSLHEI